MFNLFKQKSKVDILQFQYEKLMKESFELSKVNRAKADEKIAEAEKIIKQIELLKSKNS